MNTTFGVIALLLGVALGFAALFEAGKYLLVSQKASELKITMLMVTSFTAMFGGLYLGKLENMFHPTSDGAPQILDGRWLWLLLVMLLFLGLYFALVKLRKSPLSKEHKE